MIDELSEQIIRIQSLLFVYYSAFSILTCPFLYLFNVIWFQCSNPIPSNNYNNKVYSTLIVCFCT